jgi:hypothetical protein
MISFYSPRKSINHSSSASSTVAEYSLLCVGADVGFGTAVEVAAPFEAGEADLTGVGAAGSVVFEASVEVVVGSADFDALIAFFSPLDFFCLGG